MNLTADGKNFLLTSLYNDKDALTTFSTLSTTDDGNPFTWPDNKDLNSYETYHDWNEYNLIVDEFATSLRRTGVSRPTDG